MGCLKRVVFLTCISLIWTAVPSIELLAQPVGIMQSPSPQKQKTTVLGTGSGRYFFGQLSDSSKDQFMLDTLTGRLWRICESGEVGPFLNPVPYRDKGGKYSNLPGDPVDPGEKELKKR